MGWDGFDRFCMLSTAAEGGRGIVDAGATSRKTCSVCPHVDTGRFSNRSPRSAGESSR